jgi:predicted Zn-ribbon and HTH transcriptional regulator
MAISCPKCRELNVRRSHRRVLDFLFRSIGMVPLRCNVCGHRFFRFRKSVGLPRVDSERVAN